MISDLEQAVAAIRAGKLVAMPTETVYGLAANACDPEAVMRVFQVKRRPSFDPLIVHVTDQEMAAHYTVINETAASLMDVFWPGPLTLVLPRRSGLADAVSSGLATVGVRSPDHPMAQELISASALPLAAPSANLFGRVSPTTALHVQQQLGSSIDCILDGGPCRVGVESTVITFDEQRQVLVLRPGGISIEHLQARLGYKPRMVSSDMHSAEHLSQASPGLMKNHYAPAVPLFIKQQSEAWPQGTDWGCLSFQDEVSGIGACEVLSSGGDVEEAAQQFFAALRRLEDSGVARICAELVPPQGLGLAVNDRLCRAADKT